VFSDERGGERGGRSEDRRLEVEDRWIEVEDEEREEAVEGGRWDGAGGVAFISFLLPLLGLDLDLIWS